MTSDTFPEEVWDKVHRINLRSMWLATKYAAPHLRESTRGPSIINAGSTASLTGYLAIPVYSMTKAAIVALSRQTALDLAPAVRCNCYCPGSSDTGMIDRFRRAAEDVEALESQMVSTHLVPGWGAPRRLRSSCASSPPTTLPSSRAAST